MNTFDLLVKEMINERRFGIFTTKVKISNSSEFFHYQGASYKVLLKVFRDLIKKTSGFHFVDIGCGKGRAIFVAEFCGYNKLTGIELDWELVLEAEKNLGAYKFKRPESEIEFICQNALLFDYHSEATVYFLFNPFIEAILEQVLMRICDSNKKELIFIYMNPLFPKPFTAMGITEMIKYKSSRYVEAIVFKRDRLNS